MKNNLGSLLFFYCLGLCFGGLFLHAEDFSHTFHVDKANPYVKEAVILTLDLNQTNPDIVLLFNFDLVKSDAYTFQRLDAHETDSYHQARVHYVYLVYPLKSGTVDITFELLKKVTTDDSVAYSFSGDRDNVKGLVTVDTDVKLPALQLEVKALPDNTLLVGDFKLTHSVKKHQGEAYEPMPIQVSISGKGYPPILPTLLPKEGNFTRFTEDPVVKYIVNRQGTQSTVTYVMALSHTQSFALPAIDLKAFDPQTHKSYLLSIPSQDFNITRPKKSALVDTIDAPSLAQEDWSWLQTLLGYLVVFASGYLSALSWRWVKRQGKSRLGKHKKGTKAQALLREKIQNCHDQKTLLQLLMSSEDKRFAPTIERLEASLYGEGKIHLDTLKQDLLEKIL